MRAAGVWRIYEIRTLSCHCLFVVYFVDRGVCVLSCRGPSNSSLINFRGHFARGAFVHRAKDCVNSCDIPGRDAEALGYRKPRLVKLS